MDSYSVCGFQFIITWLPGDGRPYRLTRRIFLYLVLHSSVVLTSCDNSIKYPIGGYDFPKHIDGKDTNFYFYPILNLLPRKDSFRYAYYAPKFFKEFDEPNLSIRPAEEETFRFFYEGWQVKPVVITLKTGKIIVKKGTIVDVYPPQDQSKLSKIEQLHLHLFKRWYPINHEARAPAVKNYLDSLIELYPKLLDPNYYRDLIDKTVVSREEPFTYTTKEFSLMPSEYRHFIDLINSSGFWKLPYRIKCSDDISDGGGYFLEANTAGKYKIVMVRDCPGDSTLLTKACKEIIKYTNLDNDINLMSK